MTQFGCRRKHELLLNRLHNSSYNKRLRGTDNAATLIKTVRVTNILFQSHHQGLSCHATTSIKSCIFTLKENGDIKNNRTQDKKKIQQSN